MIGKYFSLCLIGILTCFLTGTAAREAIIHGSPVLHAHQFSYQVSVQNHQRRHVCGGGAINRIFILTAANCIMDHHRQFNTGHHYVVVGAINLNNTSPPAQIISVQRIHVPRDYNSDGYVADIALLELEYELKSFANRNNFLRLPHPHRQRNLNYTTGLIAGFGWNRVDSGGITGTIDGHLRYAETRIFIGRECEQTYSPGTVRSERHICARMHVENPDELLHFGAGKGDEGAPLVQDHDQIPLVVGVLVRRSPSCDEQDYRGYPGIYTRVLHYLTFIVDVLADKNSTNIRRYP